MVSRLQPNLVYKEEEPKVTCVGQFDELKCHYAAKMILKAVFIRIVMVKVMHLIIVLKDVFVYFPLTIAYLTSGHCPYALVLPFRKWFERRSQSLKKVMLS